MRGKRVKKKPPFFMDKRIRPLIFIIIVCIVSIPFFARGVPYDFDIDYPSSHVDARPGDIVNFVLVLNLEGGNFNRHIIIYILETEGDWEVIPEESSIIVAPDSRREITFRCTVSVNATEGEVYTLEYLFKSGLNTHTDDLEVTVDSMGFIHQPVVGGGGGLGVSGTDPGVTYLVFIPEAILVVCVIIIFIIVRKDKNSANTWEKEL
jgi:hypothetical protein